MKTKYLEFVNEALKHLPPPSDEETHAALKGMTFQEKMKAIKKNNLGEEFYPTKEEIKNEISKSKSLMEQISLCDNYKLDKKFYPVKEMLKEISKSNNEKFDFSLNLSKYFDKFNIFNISNKVRMLFFYMLTLNKLDISFNKNLKLITDFQKIIDDTCKKYIIGKHLSNITHNEMEKIHKVLCALEDIKYYLRFINSPVLRNMINYYKNELAHRYQIQKNDEKFNLYSQGIKKVMELIPYLNNRG